MRRLHPVDARPSAARRLLAALLMLWLAASAGPPRARAAWASASDLIYNSAYTLREGEFEVGLFSPLQYGVSDRVQVALHPVMLLVLAPNASLRWRLTEPGALAFALNLQTTWSFLDRVNASGQRVQNEAVCQRCGFPGTIQLTGTLSWEVVPDLMLSAGAGPAVDLLDLDARRWMAEVHGSMMWRIDSDDLLMLHGTVNVHPWEDAASSRGVVQAMYAHAWGNLHLGGGFAVSNGFELLLEESTVRSLPGRTNRVVHTGEHRTFRVYPVVDFWMRL